MMMVIQPAKHSNTLDKLRQTHFMRDVSIAIADRTRSVIRAIGEKLERRFAAFARVPYNDPLELEKWEQLWETEANEPDMSLMETQCAAGHGRATSTRRFRARPSKVALLSTGRVRP